MVKKATTVLPIAAAFDIRTGDSAEEIFERLSAAIRNGTLHDGARLPSTRDLARELNVPRCVIMRVFERLAGEGLVVPRTGHGTVVRFRRDAVVTTRSAPLPRRTAHLQTIRTDSVPATPGPFCPGVGAVDLFPIGQWRRMLSSAWAETTADMLTADGHDSDAPLRRAIAAHLGLTRGIRCDENDVMIVGSAQAAVDLTARVILNAGDKVCIEDPGYARARAAYVAAGADVISVPVDEDGFIVTDAKSHCDRPRLIYVTPAHQYPLGVALSPGRREELLDWAKSTGAWIVEDDFGGEFQYRRPPIPAMKAQDDGNAVVYIGTLTLALAAAVRIGYIVASRDLQRAIVVARRLGGWPENRVERFCLAKFMTSGAFGHHLRMLQREYLRRQQHLVKALSRRTEFVRIDGTHAGTHVVAYLREGVSDWEVAKRCAAAGVSAATLSAFAVRTACPPALVLGFGSTDERTIDRGMAILSSILNKFAPARQSDVERTLGREMENDEILI